MAVEFHDLAQVAHHLIAPAVVGRGQQQHVKTLVDLEEALPVRRRRLTRGFEFLVQGLQRPDLGRRGTARDHARGVSFEQAEQVVDIGQILLRDLGHVGAAAHFHGDQPFGGQHLERFPQRGAADTIGLGNFQLVDPAAGRQLATENPLPQQLGHFFIQCAWRKRMCCHSRNCKLEIIF